MLIQLLDIISYPLKSKIENFYHRGSYASTPIQIFINQKLIDNCCYLLSRILSELVFQSSTNEVKLNLILLPRQNIEYVFFID